MSIELALERVVLFVLSKLGAWIAPLDESRPGDLLVGQLVRPPPSVWIAVPFTASPAFWPEPASWEAKATGCRLGRVSRID